jgi:integrase
MPSLSIVTRWTKATSEKKSEPRYAVRYRLGGRTFPLEHGGSFKTLKDATERKNLIGGEIASGRNPRLLLDAMARPAAQRETLRVLADRYARSRVDLVSDAKVLVGHCAFLLSMLGDRDPHTIGWGDLQEVVAGLQTRERPAAPSTIRVYSVTWKQLFDFGGVEPNPARDKRLRLPKVIADEPDPPTAKQFLLIVENLPQRRVLPVVTMEQTAMAVGEVVSLPWGDVDTAECGFRLQRKNVKGARRARARFVQVPRFLMDAIEATCPLEDRTAERPVFPGVTIRQLETAMGNACKLAGVPRFTPHDLRHRRATIWHHGGLVAKVLAERLGHARSSMSLDVYSHTIDPGEVGESEIRALIERRENEPIDR